MNYEKQEKSNFIRHLPCTECGSRDNSALYSTEAGKSHTYCFGCHTRKELNPSTELPEVIKEKRITNMISGITEALPKRKIDSETCVID